jgi:2,3-bisphosphoglycerate-dependent phosphoglycerate mutase
LIQIVFETHATSEDNERGAASGWAHSRLSTLGRQQAEELGQRRRDDALSAVFSSDLRRAVETAEVAFEGTAIPILLDWRLRECDYGARNGTEATEHRRTRADFLDVPYPGGESRRGAVCRVGRFLDDLPLRWDGQRVLLIGHVATRFALAHLLGGVPLEDLVREPFLWHEGWECTLEPTTLP